MENWELGKNGLAKRAAAVLLLLSGAAVCMESGMGVAPARNRGAELQSFYVALHGFSDAAPFSFEYLLTCGRKGTECACA